MCIYCSKSSYGFSINDLELTSSSSSSDADRFLNILCPNPNSPNESIEEKSSRNLPSLGYLLQYFEVLCPESIPRIAKITSSFFQITRFKKQHCNMPLNGCAEQEDYAFPSSSFSSSSSSSFLFLTTSLRQAVGEDMWLQAFFYFQSGKDSLATALGVSANHVNTRCNCCFKIRFFHYFCFYCGNLFNVKKEALQAIELTSSLSILPSSSSSIPTRMQLKDVKKEKDGAAFLKALLRIEGLAAAERGELIQDLPLSFYALILWSIL